MRYLIPVFVFLMLFGLELTAGADEGDMDVVLLREEGSPFISFRVWVKVGSQDDPEGKEGLAVLTAGMIEEGSTAGMKYDEILKKLYPMAAGYGASVDKEMTVISGTVHRDNLDEYYKLFKEAVLAPAFSQEDFSRIHSQQVNFAERTRRFSSDEELGKEVLFRRIYRGTRYEAPEEGYVTSVKDLTLDDVKKFYAGYYTRDNIVIGLGGGFSDEFVNRVKADFSKLPEGIPEKTRAPKPVAVEGMNVLIVQKDSAPTTAVSFGFPFQLQRSDTDFMAMFLVNSWLGEHRNYCRLYEVIRATRGMNYGDYSYIEAWPSGHQSILPPVNVSRRHQIFQIWIRPVQHNEAVFALRAALRELDKLVEHGLSEERFEVQRKFLHNYTMGYGSTISRRLGYALDDRFYGLEQGFLNMIRPGLKKLTLEDVNEAIKKHLDYSGMWIVFISNDAEALKTALVSDAPSPKTYRSEKPQPVQDEDKEIESYPLKIKAENVHIIDINDLFDK